MHEIIVGLGFGDEGKGAAVDWLCATRPITAVIRYNGGPQAAHNVVQPDGRHHTFAQIGSGSFHDVPTHLSEHMLVNPFNLVREAQHLRDVGLDYDVIGNMTISEGALLVTPYHRAANRMRETIRGTGRHGSTGQGIGETRAYFDDYGQDAPVVGDLLNPYLLLQKLRLLVERISADLPLPYNVPNPTDLAGEYVDLMEAENLRIVPSEYIDTLLDTGDCVFEGAQGVLLDEFYGFFPHNTRTETTSDNALMLLNGREARTIGITRAYHTRHGAGPFPTENYETSLMDTSEPHNATGEFQGAWRSGNLDLTLLEYAIRANSGVDTIMVSHMDRIEEPHGSIVTYGYQDLSTSNPMMMEKINLPTSMAEQQIITDFLMSPSTVPLQHDLMTRSSVVHTIFDVTRIRPTIFSYGPTHLDKIDMEA